MAASKRGHKWSAEVTESSDALDLQKGVFEKDSPKAIASSLKRSAERSKRRKASPFQSAMSMLNFYINRAGKNLPPEQANAGGGEDSTASGLRTRLSLHHRR